MTQKDYQEFAALIKSRLISNGENFQMRSNRIPAAARAHEDRIIAERMANIFAADNPRFKRDVFLSACGL